MIANLRTALRDAYERSVRIRRWEIDSATKYRLQYDQVIGIGQNTLFGHPFTERTDITGWRLIVECDVCAVPLLPFDELPTPEQYRHNVRTCPQCEGKQEFAIKSFDRPV